MFILYLIFWILFHIYYPMFAFRINTNLINIDGHSYPIEFDDFNAFDGGKKVNY